MAAYKKFFKSKRSILLPIQQLHLQKKFPDFPTCIKGNTLHWSGSIRPHPLSKEYKVSVEYNYMRIPKAFIHDIEIKKDEKIEHTYKVCDGCAEMCLFHPRKHEWSSDMLISDTVIPWIVEWIFHYEIWRATRQWNGGGEHPQR